jgi:centromeric protein E
VSAWAWENNTISQAIIENHGNIAQKTVHDHPRDIYTFDNLFSPQHTNQEVYTRSVKPIVEEVMQGYHGSVFTYGQTSSGKTFTMNGNAKQPGVIPQTIYECFDLIKRMPGREFMFRVSYLEIYNEIVYDLLNPIPSPIKIMHNNKTGTNLIGAKEQVVTSPEEVITLLQTGEAHRHTGATGMNDKSSRAHTLFKLIVESKDINSDTKSAGVRVSSLNLIDLAGSENAKMAYHGDVKAERVAEGKFINKSLLTLSTIIQRMSEEKAGGQKQHLPFRDSKLTR